MTKGASGRPTAPATTRETSGQSEHERHKRLFKRRESRCDPSPSSQTSGMGQREIVVEHKARHQAGADEAGRLRRRSDGARAA